SMTGIKCRLIAHIEIAQRAERRQVADIDKGIVWHRRSLFLRLPSALAVKKSALSAGQPFRAARLSGRQDSRAADAVTPVAVHSELSISTGTPDFWQAS